MLSPVCCGDNRASLPALVKSWLLINAWDFIAQCGKYEYQTQNKPPILQRHLREIVMSDNEFLELLKSLQRDKSSGPIYYGPPN